MDSQVAAKAVIVNLDNQVLMMCEKGRWQAPGGRLEAGETLLQGLKREVFEQTGIIKMEVGEAIHIDEWFGKPEGVKKHIVAIFYVCNVASDNVELSDEHDDYAWITLDELNDFIIEPEMKRAIKKLWSLNE